MRLEVAMIRKMKSAGSVVVGTLVVTGVLAALIAGFGVMMSLEVSYERVPGSRGRIEEDFRKMVQRVDLLEIQWKEALSGRAGELLVDWGNEIGREAGVAGLLRAGLLDPHRDHGDAGAVVWLGAGELPKLGKFAEEEEGWVFPDSVVEEPERFRHERGEPAIYVKSDGRKAVVLVLDLARAAKIAQEALQLEVTGDDAGGMLWLGPGGVEVGRVGLVPDRRADESVRHVSLFGDWTMQEWYPVVERTSYRMPVLVGASALAVLVLLGGSLLAMSQQKALKMAAQQVSFVNRVSHELRTPLTNLLLNTDLALDSLGAEDGKVRRRLGLIREETGRLSRIVDNVLAFARVGRARNASPGCDVGEVIMAVSEGFRPLFERKGMRCEVECSSGLWCAADADSLAQILSNLLSNAEKYAGEGARIKVSAVRTPEALLIEVRDNGPGVPWNFRRQLFTPFSRARNALNEGVSGTGLGLSISRDLAEQMGGRLDSVEQLKGAGFQVSLPIDGGRKA